jgi:hypothetical protein
LGGAGHVSLQVLVHEYRLLSPAYHGESSTVTLKHLGRSYTVLTEDTTRVKSRIKALYRSQAIASIGK